MSQLTESELRHSLTTAVDQHAKIYTKSFSLHIRWEDDTEAQRDCDNFQSFLAAFGFSPPSIVTLETKDWTHGWTVFEKTTSMLREAFKFSTQGRCICFIHYAGHSVVGPNNTIRFTSALGTRSLDADWLITTFSTDEGGLPYDAPVDIVYVLDCRYSFLRTKSAQPVSRSVDVLAAIDTNAPRAFVPDQRVSFSAKLAEKVTDLKETGRQTIDMAELIAMLRTELSQRKPTHAVPLGVSSACLSFPGSSAPRAYPADPPALRAVFSVEVDKDFSDQDLRNMMEWLHSLGPYAGLILDAVYRTSSTGFGFVLQGSYAVYSKLKGLPSVKLLFECSGGNCLPSVLAGSPDVRSPRGPSRVE
ncbi:hypothetical protein DTO166G4_7164 [Paecilomyces variotii]|nr:hypothetical protein DTO166G4_7164 [Paecilomyces variotii]KAJ9241531.1 hypothetical protein DTO166G5_1152 [Paecilomyces variotii]KAJ9261937.1 hypothetical protein DTO195F2_3925 [Paecilomyces variotii]KAJ9374758.1 hypothetical protein DTO282E5_313 [Paecilomyces variotii]